jgi:preprotein translocase subunit SecF
MDEETEKPKQGIREFYDKQYKKLLVIPFLLLFLAIGAIFYQYSTTGDFISRDVSLKGGLTITIPLQEEVSIIGLKNSLSSEFPQNDVSVRALRRAGKQRGVIITSDIDGSKKTEVGILMDFLRKELNKPLVEDDYSIEFIGSSLGASFFREAIKAIYIAFLFMGAVVFLYFGTKVHQKVLSLTLAIIAAVLIFMVKNPVTDIIAYLIGLFLIFIYIKHSAPSVAVILAAFSDMVITLAIVNLLGIKISTAGIAAFLILIGYSVDTDILLSTRVLKRKGGSLMDRIVGAFKTGIMMSITTLAAVTVALVFTQSEVIRQIMSILLIGLVVDIINTWIQNVGILRLYIENKEKKIVKQ